MAENRVIPIRVEKVCNFASVTYYHRNKTQQQQQYLIENEVVHNETATVNLAADKRFFPSYLVTSAASRLSLHITFDC